MRLRPHPGWLLAKLIPLARLTLLDGNQTVGKGVFCILLAMAVLVTGQDVLWLTTEDDPEGDILPRLLAAGYDPSKHGAVWFLDEQGACYMPRDVALLRGSVQNHGKFGLIILDPGRSFLKNPDTNMVSYKSEEDVRPGLEALNKLAIDTGVPIVFIHHWNRDSTLPPSERYSQSGAFAQVVRHRVTLARVGEERAVSVTESNLSAVGFVQAYSIEEVVLTAPDGSPVPTPRFVLGDPLADEDLDAWWRRLNKKMDKVEFTPADELDWFLCSHCKAGDLIPNRDELAGLTGMSQTRVKAGLAGLKVRGQVSSNGRGLLWTPDGGVAGAH